MNVEEREKILWNNEWLSVRRIRNPSKGVYGYYYLHEERCNGYIASILPFRINEYKITDRKEFLVRSELTPCWDIENNVYSSITGGFDLKHGGSIAETARAELREETGYIVKLQSLINLGTCYGTKSTDTVYHLFSVDLTNLAPGRRESEDYVESQAQNVWISASKIINEVKDPLASTLLCRLLYYYFGLEGNK